MSRQKALANAEATNILNELGDRGIKFRPEDNENVLLAVSKGFSRGRMSTKSLPLQPRPRRRIAAGTGGITTPEANVEAPTDVHPIS